MYTIYLKLQIRIRGVYYVSLFVGSVRSNNERYIGNTNVKWYRHGLFLKIFNLMVLIQNIKKIE